MNIAAVVAFIAIGLIGNWGLAFAFLGGYCLAWVIVGVQQGRGGLR